MSDLDNFLEHIGVRGMRWGHRRAQQANSGPRQKTATLIKGAKKVSSVVGKKKSEKPEEPGSTDHERAKTIKKKKLSEMSNEEIQVLATRMALEKQYKDLNESKTSRGKKVVLGLVANSGKQAASTILTEVLTTQGKRLVAASFKAAASGA